MARIKETNGKFEASEMGALLEIEHDQESNHLSFFCKNWVYLDRDQAGRLYDWLKKNLRRMNNYKKVRERSNGRDNG